MILYYSSDDFEIVFNLYDVVFCLLHKRSPEVITPLTVLKLKDETIEVKGRELFDFVLHARPKD